MTETSETAASATAPDREIDPFGLIPDLASVIGGLHGTEATDATYVFHSSYIDDLSGMVTMELRFEDLQSRKDRMVLSVHAFNLANDRLDVLSTTDVSLRTVAAAGGRTAVRFRAVPGFSYAVLGRTTVPPQARARRLTIHCRQSEWVPEPVEAPPVDVGFQASDMRAVAILAGDHPPLLLNPTSQAMTRSQLRERTFRTWQATADLPTTTTTAEQWEIVYLLQALKVFGIVDVTPRGLGFGPSPRNLIAALHALGCTTDAAATIDDGRAGGAPGVNDGYFNRIALPDPAEHGRYDFLWSAGLSGLLETAEDIIHLVEDSLAYLRRGGIAVHLLSADLRPAVSAAGGGAIFTRNDLGRLALAVVAGKDEIAQLNMFADDRQDMPVPYAVLIRKG